MIESIPCIVVKVTDLTNGFWPAFHKLNQEPGLEFSTKIRIGALFKDLSRQADELQKAYNEQIDALTWETDADGKKKCLDVEKKEEIEASFLNTEITILGRALKAEAIKTARLSAQDIAALAPIITGLGDIED
jgi:hypothetical protein